jgi:hypothetical protein
MEFHLKEQIAPENSKKVNQKLKTQGNPCQKQLTLIRNHWPCPSP